MSRETEHRRLIALVTEALSLSDAMGWHEPSIYLDQAHQVLAGMPLADVRTALPPVSIDLVTGASLSTAAEPVESRNDDSLPCGR